MGRGNQKVCVPTTGDRFAAVLGTRRQTTKSTPSAEMDLLRELAETPMPVKKFSTEYGDLFLTFTGPIDVYVSSSTAFDDREYVGKAEVAEPLTINGAAVKVNFARVKSRNLRWHAEVSEYGATNVKSHRNA